MNKYTIPFEGTVTVYVTLEAESKEEAISLAQDEAYITAYCGNEGNDKLIGVSDSGDAELSIEASEFLEVSEEDIIEE
jgi:hypothetical protein